MLHHEFFILLMHQILLMDSHIIRAAHILKQ